VELTPEPDQRARRALEAAQATYEAGAFETALELLTVAAAGPLDALQRARVTLLRAQIAFYVARHDDVPAMLLEAAAALAPLDPALSRETYLQALETAITILGDARSVRDVAEAARAAPPPPGPSGPVDLLLDALVAIITRGLVSGAPQLRRALEAFRAHDPHAEGVPAGELRRWLSLASSTALAVYDDESLFVLTDRTVRLAREAGALATLYSVLLLQVATLQLSGKLAQAAELADEQVTITQVLGALPLRHAKVLLAAWRGDETESAALYAAILPEKGDRGHVTEVTQAQIAQAVLQNSLGNYPAALDAAERVVESDELWYVGYALPEVVEAASRADRPERAAAALEQLSARAAASGTEWALGVAARCRALTSAGPDAEEHYRDAIERLGRCRIAVDLARAHLVYGEWLRREGRRQDARDQLRTAHELLSDMGARRLRGARRARAARDRRKPPSADLPPHRRADAPGAPRGPAGRHRSDLARGGLAAVPHSRTI
jgi:tetratricopeptide (TPR) repeat protein